MGYKTVSQNRVSAKTAESSAVAITANISGNGYVISGPYTTLNSTAIYEATVTPGSTTTKSPIAAAGLAGSPTITGVQYLNSVNQTQAGLTAVSTLGGSILISGTNFTPNVTVWFGNTRVANTVISSVQILATLPANAAGNANILVAPAPPPAPSTVNIQFYPAPVWQNSNVNLYYTMNNTSSNIPLTVTTTTGDTVVFSNTALPIGLTLSPNVTNFGNGTYQTFISGTINSYPGGYNNVAFSVTATNSRNEFTTLPFTANINAPVPQWVTGSTLVYTQNSYSYTTQISATISDCAPLTYTLVSGSLPTGMNINSAGYITGTISGYGTGYTCVPFTVTVSDIEGQSNTQVFTANIANTPYTINYLVVGGGGGGGCGPASPRGAPGAGGGGAGGFLCGTYTVNYGQTYAITVGGGGGGATHGGPSRLCTPTSTAIALAYGGGGSNTNVCAGASGSGAGSNANSPKGYQNNYTPGQGNSGGVGIVACSYAGGGMGGGAGGAGNNGYSYASGGASKTWSINGVAYAGGGGGTVSGTTRPSGGGAAGVGGSGPGGGGGGGIVIISYLAPAQLGCGGSVSGGPAGPRWFHTFTGSGTYRA